LATGRTGRKPNQKDQKPIPLHLLSYLEGVTVIVLLVTLPPTAEPLFTVTRLPLLTAV
jgi:hypothetical protein